MCATLRAYQRIAGFREKTDEDDRDTALHYNRHSHHGLEHDLGGGSGSMGLPREPDVDEGPQSHDPVRDHGTHRSREARRPTTRRLDHLGLLIDRRAEGVHHAHIEGRFAVRTNLG